MRHTDQRELDYPALDANQLLSHREIAAELGIGRARVFFHEQAALKKIREALSSQGVGCQADLESMPFLRISEPTRSPRQQPLERFSSLHGWLRVDRIVSVNAGGTVAQDVAEAFKWLKLAHESLVRPPLLVTTSDGVKSPYRVEAVGIQDGGLRVRCWPNAAAPRTVAALKPFPCTAIVESIFDCDAMGEFDIPLINCVIISAREAKGLNL